MKINAVLAVACLLIMVFTCGCLEDEEGKVITMTMEEFVNDYDINMDNGTKKFTGWYKSLNESDTLIISDTINNITYLESQNYTPVEFESLLGQNFPIEGDITDTFEKGDNVKITMHAIKVIFTQQIYNETWTIELETFREEWDSENNTYIPIPQKYIRLLESDEGKVITMTMDELMNDYDQSVNNDTKKITYLLKSLNHGNTLIIRDKINDVIYNKSGNYTTMDFETSVGYHLYIEGDITDGYGKGDDIEITLHIIKDIFTQQNSYTGEIWIFEHETFKEGWDSEHDIYIPLPQNVIRPA